MFAIIEALTGILKPAEKIIDDLNFSEEEKSKAKLKLSELQNKIDTISLEAEKDALSNYQKILLADAQSDSKIQKIWRPLLSLSFGVIVVLSAVTNIISSFIPKIQTVVIDPHIWDIMLALIGIHALSRGGEKIAKSLKQR